MTICVSRVRAGVLVAGLCTLAASAGLPAQGAPQDSAREQLLNAAIAARPKLQAATPAGGQDGYSYRPEGRRDPFLSLINRVVESRPTARRPDGVRGLLFNDIVLRGVVQGGRPGAIAIVQATDMKSYRLHVGDQLFDAVVKAITADSLIVLQEVNDPLSLQKQAERRKTLRVVEEVK